MTFSLQHITPEMREYKPKKQKQSFGATIYKVHILATGEEKTFGSISAIYEHFTKKDLGVVASTLYNFGIEPDRPYSNVLCIIKKDAVIRKKRKG